MDLHPSGAHAAQLGHAERRALGIQLMSGTREMRDFVREGNCFDVTAFVRFLLGARISTDDLLELYGQEWAPRFNFPMGRPWDGRAAIPTGTAVGFRRERDGRVFHAGVAVGGTTLRSVNAGPLGQGWSDVSDLKKVLPRHGNGTFTHDRAPIKVFLSTL